MPSFPPEKVGRKRTLLGIDLRAFSVKVVEVDVAAAVVKAKKWGMEEFEPSVLQNSPLTENPKYKALRSILDKKQIKTKDAAVCISGPEVTVKHFLLPKLSPGDTREAIGLQVGNWISFPAEEAIFDFTPLKEASGQIHYLVAIARRSLVYETVALLKACGLNCLYLSVIPLALLNVFPLPTNVEAATCLIYMGKHNANINIFKHGVFEFNREVTVGGDTITRAMVGVVLTDEGKIELDYERAEELKKKLGIPLDLDAYSKEAGLPAVQILAFMRPALEKIEAEMLRSFNYYRSQTGDGDVGKIIITGGAAKTKNLLGLINEALGIPVEAGIPGGAGPADLEAVKMDLAVAIGVALEGKEPKINLLPEEIKERVSFLIKKAVRVEFIAAGSLVVLLTVYLIVLGLGFLLQARLNMLEAQIKSLSAESQQAAILEQQMQGIEVGKTVFSGLLEKHKKLGTVLEDVGRVIPANVILNELIVKDVAGGQREISFSGTAFSYDRPREEGLSLFIARLEKLKELGTISLVSANVNENYTQPALDFMLSAKLER